MKKATPAKALCSMIGMTLLTFPTQAFVKRYVPSFRSKRLTSFARLANTKQPIPAVSVIVRKNYEPSTVSPSYLLVQRGKVGQITC